ncbi:MAG: hypothetical protein P8Y99_04930 [Calditrichaceae bacterium]
MLIIVFAAGLIAVILIPGEIWKEEANNKATAENNMASIYEGLRFYHRITNEYTTDPQKILSVVRSDSSILLQQKVVNHTEQLTKLIDAYIKDKYISSLLSIYDNIDKIVRDLDENRYHFEAVDDYFKNEAEAIATEIRELKMSVPYEKFALATGYIDSLKELRRDLSDFSLQAGAVKATSITDTLKTLLPAVDINGLASTWQPISNRSEEFITRIRRSEELSKLTSVGDRVQDFREKIMAAFEQIRNLNIQDNIASVNKISDELNDLYEVFLRDFIATSKPALYKLSLSDSLVIHLTEDKFYSPVTGEMYKILILDDSSSVKVESPILVNELKDEVKPIVDKINDLPILPAFNALFDSLEKIQDKAQITRKALRRNTDIFIKFKEIEEIVSKFSDIYIGTAYTNFNDFVTVVPNAESYSEIRAQLKNAFIGGGLFYDAYDKQDFGKLDSLQKDLKVKLEEFNGLLDEVRRLPKDVTKYDKEFSIIDQLVGNIKSLNVLDDLKDINKDLEESLIFAAEGSSKREYGIFYKEIKNLGYIYKDKKSWEEED